MGLDRRTFISTVAAAAVMPRPAGAQAGSTDVVLYAAVGAVLTQYEVDVDSLTLTPRGTVALPANVQYAWPHQSRRHLYVATSGPAAGAEAAGAVHHVSAFRIDPSGALTPHGNSITLPTRPIHLTADHRSEHVLIAFNNPSALRVYRINRDATLGSEVTQSATLDFGIYAHQVRMAPSGRFVVLVARGNDRTDRTPEDPGSLKTFSYRDGLLTNEATIAPNGGYGFGPRHLDFHPSEPWVYVSPGEPTPIQHIETRGIHCRTFHIDPSGRMLVAAHNVPVLVRDDSTVTTVPACLSVFRIGPDGRLDFVRKYNVDTRDRIMFWMGMVAL